MEKIDLHSLNLFGVPLEETSDKDQFKDVAGSNQETQRVLRDLIELTEEINGNSLSNFGIRKSFVYYDPYEPDFEVSQTYLKFEDSERLRASIVLDFYRK